eukprot:355136-Chlamydomonas_euryale.AAC.2
MARYRRSLSNATAGTCRALRSARRGAAALAVKCRRWFGHAGFPGGNKQPCSTPQQREASSMCGAGGKHTYRAFLKGGREGRGRIQNGAALHDGGRAVSGEVWTEVQWPCTILLHALAAAIAPSNSRSEARPCKRCVPATHEALILCTCPDPALPA